MSALTPDMPLTPGMPFERRMAGQIDTVTVDSVVRFVHQRDPLAWEISVGL